MKSKKTKLKTPSELRKSPENKLKSQITPPGGRSDKDTQQLIHELQVHQIELEMQNDELRKSQAELEESRAQYPDLYDFAPVGYFTFNKDGLILEANITVAKELGIERSLLINKPFRAYIVPEDRKIFDSHLQKVFKNKDQQTCGIRLKRKDGKEFYAQLESIFNDFNSNALCRSSVSDITDRKRSEESLRSEKEFINTALDNQLDTFFLFEPATGKALRWNRAFREISGYTDKEIDRMPAPTSYYSPEDMERAAVFTQGVLEGKAETIELELLCKDGRKIPTEYRVSVIKDERGKPRYFISIGRDITERKKAEDDLQKSEERFRALIEHSHDAITLLTADGTVLYDSPSIMHVLGYSPTERIGRSVFEFVPPEERQNVAYGFTTFVQQPGAVDPSEVRFLHKDGTLRQIEGTRSNLLHDSKVRAVVVNYRDITERKRAEEILKKQERELAIKAKNLEEANIALKVLLRRTDEDRAELEEKVLLNVRDLVVPYLEKLKSSSIDETQRTFVNILESNLLQIISPFSQKMSSKFLNFTPTEMQVADLLRKGKTSKEIGELLNASPRAITFHRENIRKKLGLKNKKANLKSYLLSIK